MTQYRLKTLGGMSVVGELSEGSAATIQKGRLAILIRVAAAGPVGISRERLAAVFWPESDEERSRNALNQALFGLRRATSVQLID